MQDEAAGLEVSLISGNRLNDVSRNDIEYCTTSIAQHEQHKLKSDLLWKILNKNYSCALGLAARRNV